MTIQEQVKSKAKEVEKFIGHYIVDEDSWFSCSLYCCDDNRASDKCDCGVEEKRIELAKFCLASEIKGKIDILHEFNSNLAIVTRIDDLQKQLSQLEAA